MINFRLPYEPLSDGLLEVVHFRFELALQYTAAGPGKRLALLLHHDDADREYAYDRDFKLSPLIEARDIVPQLNGGMIVSLKQDWNRVFTF